MSRKARMLPSFRGETLSLPEWANRLGISAETLRARLDQLGWPLEKALTTPSAGRSPAASPPAPRGANPPRYPARPHSSGQAMVWVRVGGKRQARYLGPWNSAESREAYRRLVAEWSAAQVQAAAGQPAAAGLEVAPLVVRFLDHARTHYVKHGRITSEYGCQVQALGVLVGLYGDTPAAEFGPAGLKACQAAMVAKGWGRRSINLHTWRIKNLFAWGVAESLIPVAVHAALLRVPGLKAGKTAAPERKRKSPVLDLHLALVLAVVDPPVRAMLWLQRFTGMRPGEVCTLRPSNIDRAAGAAWLCTVAGQADKNEARRADAGRDSTYWLGPEAQAALIPLLAAAAAEDAPLFVPPRKRSRDQYTRGYYRSCVVRACKRLGIPSWHPHRLRHTRDTELRRLYGVEAAQEALGHDSPDMVAVYAERSEDRRRQIARDTG